MLERIEEVGWEIFNGGTKGDEEGEWTYTGAREESVIDYVIENRVVRDKIERLQIEDNVDSDYHPVVIWIKGGGRGKGEKKGVEVKMSRFGQRKVRKNVEKD